MKVSRIARGILGVVMALSGQVACCALAYVITLKLQPLLGVELSDLPRLLINVTLGSLFAFLIIVAIGLISRPKQIHFIHAIMDTMKEMSKGNFNVSLEKNRHHQGHFEVFVDSINHMAQELKHIEAMRQEFISNVSHEIQSPLTSINGFAQALQHEELSEEERLRYLHIIETESKRLSRLSDNLLKLTSLQSEHHPFHPQSYRLDHQLRSIVLVCEPQWLGKRLDMDISLTNVQVTADEDMMNQVWINLIHNSIKFTPDGGTIGISLEKVDNAAVIRIYDTGIGISAQDQERIFERFFKADASRNRTGSGSGLGLSIVHKIVEKHQGSIRVESKPDEGSTFIVTLPDQT
jgi:two-component system phosphate regulon sensor histidine kinase PhoR